MRYIFYIVNTEHLNNNTEADYIESSQTKYTLLFTLIHLRVGYDLFLIIKFTLYLNG